MSDPAALWADPADDCPVCRSYRCAGHKPRADCGHGAEIAARHRLHDHRFCDPATCEVADMLHALVVPVGLAAPRVSSRPLALVSIAEDPPRVLGLYADHRDGKPARTRIATARGLPAWRGKALGYTECPLEEQGDICLTGVRKICGNW